MKSIIGLKFSRLTVLRQVEADKYCKTRYACLCDCGKEVEVRGTCLTTGNTKSCGCLSGEMLADRNKSRATHGKSRSSEYGTFYGARARCNNPKNQDYLRYGGRGIQFKFSSFEELYKEVGPKPSPEHSLDRIDNNGNYEPGNVQWATAEEQSNNKRSVDEINYDLLVAYANSIPNYAIEVQ
jgi:hypothetical protein